MGRRIPAWTRGVPRSEDRKTWGAVADRLGQGHHEPPGGPPPPPGARSAQEPQAPSAAPTGPAGPQSSPPAFSCRPASG
eukprot:1268007-Alexandrium_andersonii.AAC.1